MADDTRTDAATVRWTDFLGWGPAGRPDEDDPAETYHEASKNLPSVRPRVSSAATALDADRQAQATIARSVKRHPTLRSIALPRPHYPAGEVPFEQVMQGRRSRRSFGPGSISLRDLATLLHAAYGITQDGTSAGVGTAGSSDRSDGSDGGQASDAGAGAEVPGAMRSVPSGGALYPLEIYPVVRNVVGLEPGLYHYDPSAHVLEVLDEREVSGDLGEVMIPLPDGPNLATTCGAVLFVVGVFWRTRFKYGLRGYRWTLIEAGHVGQSFLLAAEALGLPAVPYGGFWDRRVDDLLGVDGVNESVIYSLVTGSSSR